MSTKAKTLQDLKQLPLMGYTDIVLFGRFQPLHKGHKALLETMRASDLNVNLVINDKTDGAEGGERNPFSPYQRQEMVKLALDWMTDDNIRHANVYLGGGGDVGPAVRKLTNIFETIAPADKLVFAYFEKAEDRKTYLVDGQEIHGVHYVDLVGKPRGKFPVVQITEPLIREVTGSYYPIDAKMFRNGIKQRDQIVAELQDPAVFDYTYKQLALADLNKRPVGACQASDRFTLAQLDYALLATTNIPLYSNAPDYSISQAMSIIDNAVVLLEHEMV